MAVIVPIIVISTILFALGRKGRGGRKCAVAEKLSAVDKDKAEAEHKQKL